MRGGRLGSGLAVLFNVCVVCVGAALSAEPEVLRLQRPAAPVTQTALQQVFKADLIFAEARKGYDYGPFENWRRRYATPPICGMVLCAGSCKDFQDACPPFSGLSVFDPLYPGVLVTDRGCAASATCAQNVGACCP